MEITLKTLAVGETSHISKMYVNGVYECDILEDSVRQTKIFGKTAIPSGRYEIILNMSNRFKQILPLLLNVPGYEGVRIHPGNKPEDTEGCLLPGVYSASIKNWVSSSKREFLELMVKLNRAQKAKEKIYITITR